MNDPDGIVCSFCWSSSLSTYSCASPRRFGAFLVFLKRGQSWKTLLITPVRSIGLFVWLRITQDAQGCWDIKNLCSFKKEKGWFGFWWRLECFVSLMPCSWHFVIAFCSLAFPWHMNMLKKKKFPVRNQWASLNFQSLELWSSLPLSTGGWPCQILIAYVNIW